MIYLFGSTGMLGTYVTKTLSNYFNIICITRNEFDILNDTWPKLNKILSGLNENDVIINCAGIIPQKTNDNEYGKYIKINTLFPHKLQEIVEKSNAKFIHITTDCVFDGKKGSPYNENDTHTETNIYGVSKSLGEPENATVIRTSIIGEELKDKKSLLEWVKSNKNKTINGYSNHLWNGVTCLTLANIIKEIIDINLFWNGVRHIFSPNIVSKYDLCTFINDIYQLNIIINNMENVNRCNKSLYSLHDIKIFNIDDIKTQILQLRNFNEPSI